MWSIVICDRGGAVVVSRKTRLEVDTSPEIRVK